MPIDKLPQVPFGAVYFRKSNPPREDWERDYGVAAEDGLNVFRHWFMWGVDRAPARRIMTGTNTTGRWTWPPKNGIKTIIAELIHAVPDWAMRNFAHARQVRMDGRPLTSNMGVSAATGGFANNGGGAGALTLNCPEVKEAAGNFLKALATRYKGHPALLGYDVWNEVNYSPMSTIRSYAQGRLPRLAAGGNTATSRRWPQAWHRYCYAEWDDIEPPAEIARLSGMPRLARLQAGQLLRPDAVADRHDPRGRPGLPDRRARHRRRHSQYGGAMAATTGSPPRRSRSTA